MSARKDPAGVSTSDMSQQGLYQQDSGYYGAGQQPSQSEAIPLQDRPTKDAVNPEFNDHVYDAPPGTRSGRRRRKRKVGLGQLGMLGADKKRIPWVVYTFSVIQIAVFIAEIVENGEYSRLEGCYSHPSPLCCP